MYFKGETPLSQSRWEKKKKTMIEKLGKEVFIDNVSISIAAFLP